MRQQDNTLTTDSLIAALTPILLSEACASQAIQKSLDMILAVTGVCRVYMFDLREDPVNGYISSQKFESCRADIEPQIDNPNLQDIPVYPDYRRWVETFLRNEPVVGLIRDFPASEREYLQEQDILSLLILPIFSAGKPIAFVGFDDTQTERDWDNYQVNILSEAVILLGSLLIRNEQEEKLRLEQEQREHLFEQVQTHRKQLVSLTENITDGIWMRDAQDFSLLFTNKTITDMFGIPGEALKMENGDRYLQYVHPADRELVAEQNELHHQTRKNVEVEWRLIGADQKTRWVRARLFTVFNEVTGEPQYHCGVLTDISEQRRQLTILREAKNQSEELNRIKSNILSNIRHEFRTPLTGIKGFADLIQMGTDDDELHEYSKSITISANRLQNTLDSLLDFSVVDAGFVKANPSWISVEETILDLIKTLENKAHKKGLRFSLNFSGKDRRVYMDEHILYTVTRQLFDNASKFTRHGQIEVRIEVVAEYLSMQIADTGCGIPEDIRSRLFEPFRQGSEGVRRTFEGTGLGLPIVHRYLQMVNGTINFEPNEPSGTVAKVLIPLSYVRQQSMQRVETSYQGGHTDTDAARKVLYVEDNALMQGLMKQALKKHALDVAGTAEEAIELIEKNCYEIMLVDINLGPGMSGIEFCKIARKSKNNSKAYIAAVTASNRSELEGHLHTNGFDRLISKPFNIREVISLVDEHVSLRMTSG